MAESREPNSNEQLIQKLEHIKNLYAEVRKDKKGVRIWSKVKSAIDTQIERIRDQHELDNAGQAQEIKKALNIISNRFADGHRDDHSVSTATYQKIYMALHPDQTQDVKIGAQGYQETFCNENSPNMANLLACMSPENIQALLFGTTSEAQHKTIIAKAERELAERELAERELAERELEELELEEESKEFKGLEEGVIRHIKGHITWLSKEEKQYNIDINAVFKDYKEKKPEAYASMMRAYKRFAHYGERLRSGCATRASLDPMQVFELVQKCINEFEEWASKEDTSASTPNTQRNAAAIAADPEGKKPDK
jgi:hypothetical protein